MKQEKRKTRERKLRERESPQCVLKSFYREKKTEEQWESLFDYKLMQSLQLKPLDSTMLLLGTNNHTVQEERKREMQSKKSMDPS